MWSIILAHTFFTVKGAALGFPAAASSRTADVHTGGAAFAVFIVSAVADVAADIGFRASAGVAGHHIGVVVASLGKAAAAGFIFAISALAVHLDALQNAQVVLIVGAVAGVASQIAHRMIFLSCRDAADFPCYLSQMRLGLCNYNFLF